MAIVKPISQDMAKSIGKTLIFYKVGNQMRVRTWPRKYKWELTPARAFTHEVKRGCHIAAKDLGQDVKEYYTQNAQSGGFTWLDSFMSRCMRAYYETEVLPVYLTSLSYYFDGGILKLSYTLSNYTAHKITLHRISNYFPTKHQQKGSYLAGCDVPDDPPPDDEEESDEPDDEGYGIDWKPTGPELWWQGCAMSADGKYKGAVALYDQIHISNNYGITWKGKGLAIRWSDCCISNTGEIQYKCATSGEIFKSTDHGETWNQKGPSKNWNSIACSGNGQYVLVSGRSTRQWLSTDYGETWNQKGVYYDTWGAAVSNSGQYMFTTTYGDKISVSNDYGANWSQKGQSTLYIGVAISGDGKYGLATAPQQNNTYRTTDYGQTWLPILTGQTKWIPAINHDGKWQILCHYGSGQIKISEDYGANWNDAGPIITARGSAISDDGADILITRANAASLIMSRPGNEYSKTSGMGAQIGDYIKIATGTEKHIAAPYILLK